MASLIWRSVYAFLILELIITIILVIPVHRRTRNWIARKVSNLGLGKKIFKPMLAIGIGLAFGILESYWTIQRLLEREREAKEDASYHHSHHHHPSHDLEKQRLFKAERNLYLSAFALTLVFVIGRICELMHESVEHEDEKKRMTEFTSESKKYNDDKDENNENKPQEPVVDKNDVGKTQVEMTEIKKKPQDKKDD